MKRPWFGDLPASDYPREKIRATLLAAGAPPQHVDEVVDIACHASASARKTMLEVLDRASEYRVALIAIGIAVALVRTEAEWLEQGLKHAAAAAGLKTFEGRLQGESDG